MNKMIKSNQTTHETIALVLNPNFGNQVRELLIKMPVWIMASPANDIAMENARLEFGRECLTALFVRTGESLENFLLRAINDIDEHYGIESQSCPYKKLLVYSMQHTLPADFVSELKFSSVVATLDDFVVEKLKN